MTFEVNTIFTFTWQIGNQGSEKLSDLCQLTQQMSKGANIGIQVCRHPVPST